jgi:ABC-type sugar transport system ATPase subunit
MIDILLDVTLRQGAFELRVRESASVEVLGLFGPSGAGKTTLLETIAGIRTPEAGEIKVGSRTLFSSAARINVPARDRHIGYVPQDALLFPNLNVKGNIGYGAGRAGGAGRASADPGALVEMLDLKLRIDLGEVENVVDEREQIDARQVNSLRELDLFLAQILSIMSLASSVPNDSLIRPGETPAARRSSSVLCG